MMEALRRYVQSYVERSLIPLVRFLARLGIGPDPITWAGFVVTLFSSGLLLFGYPLTAGILFLLGSTLDLLDGALARLQKQVTPFGAFLDSTLDRLGEGALCTAIAYHFAATGDALAVAGTMLALLGGMLTSYTRARGEALGIPCTAGWITRPERVILLALGLILGLLAEVVYLLAVLTLWTSLQRIYHVYKALHSYN
jgi:CDP-diacylglycerol--glycerol-3-phosphate 3-phosphatidyltransferase